MMMAEGDGGGALAGLRVLDLTDESGRGAGRVLAEAGASVLRTRRGEAGPPMSEDPDERGGVLDWWFDGGTRRTPLDLGSERDRDAFRVLAARADLLIESAPPGRLAALGLDYADLSRQNPALVHVSLTPFGRVGPRSGWATSDLVQAALGGVLSVTGDPERPLNGWGRQTGTVGGMYAAILGLAGVRAARMSGKGTHIDLSLHEAVIANTEQVLMYWFYQRVLPRAIALRQRALHWSGLYDVLAARDGHVMITPASDMPAQLDSLTEDGITDFEDLRTLAPGPEFAARVPAFMAALAGWAATKEAEPLFLDGQRRGLPYGLVQGIAQVAASPQHAARGAFRPVAWDGPEVRIPGPLVRLPETPAPPAAPPPAHDTAPEEALAAWPARSTPNPSPNPMDATQPLAGLRVLDFSWVLAGPFATRTLAELGADVIKVQTGVRSQGANSNAHPYFVMWNRGKRAFTLNMKHPDGVATLRRLVEQSDVLIENFSAGVLERWGAGPETLREWNERLIYVGMSGCGKTGPWRDFVTYAPTIHALCGLTALTGHEGERNCGYGLSFNDHASGLAGALAVLEALHARERTGRGQFIDMSQLEVGLSLVGPALVEYLNTGREPVARGNRDPFSDPVPNEVYRCADSGWLAITARDEGDWTRLLQVVDDGALRDDRLGGVDGRREHRALVNERLGAWAAGRDAESAMRALQAVGVPAGKVQDASDLAERDEQLAARGWLTQIENPVLGPSQLDRFPARFDGEPPPPPSPAPGFGDDTFAICTELLGMSEAEVAGAMANGLLS